MIFEVEITCCKKTIIFRLLAKLHVFLSLILKERISLIGMLQAFEPKFLTCEGCIPKIKLTI